MKDFLYSYGVLFGVVNLFGFVVLFVVLMNAQAKENHLFSDFRFIKFFRTLIIVTAVSFAWMPITLVQTLRGINRAIKDV